METKVNSRVTLSHLEPCPTRKFDFKWVSGQNSLRVTKLDNGPREVAWVRPKNKPNGSKTQPIDPMSLEPQHTGPLDVDLTCNEVLPQNNMEDSGTAEREVSSLEQLEDPSDVGPVAVMVEEETGSGDFDAEVSRGPSSVMAAPVPSDSSSLAMVWVDLADNSQYDAHIGALALGSTHELDVPSEIVGLESDYMDSVVRLPVLELSEYDVDPQSPMVCKPLAIIEPLVQIGVVSGNSAGKRSEWVNQQYQEICKWMGFLIDSHEQQCLELLRRIEATRDSKRGEMGSQKVTTSK